METVITIYVIMVWLCLAPVVASLPDGEGGYLGFGWGMLVAAMSPLLLLVVVFIYLNGLFSGGHTEGLAGVARFMGSEQ